MEKWKLKVGFWLRLKLAWKAFWLQNHKIQDFLPYQQQSELISMINGGPMTWPCDIENCGRAQKVCYSRSDFFMRIGVDADEHLHVCEGHAGQLEGRYKKLDGYIPNKRIRETE